MPNTTRTLEEILDGPAARGGLQTTHDALTRRTIVCFDGGEAVQVFRQAAGDTSRYELLRELNPFEGWTASRRREQRVEEWLPHVIDEVINPFAIVFCTDDASPQDIVAMPPGAYNNPHLHPCVQGTFPSQIQAARFVQKAWIEAAIGTVMAGMVPDVDHLIEHGYVMDPRSINQARAFARTGEAEYVSGWTIVDRAEAAQEVERRHMESMQGAIDYMAKRNQAL